MTTALWHPFSNMSTYPDQELMIESADGCWIQDSSGRRYLDGTASLWYCNVGHGREEIADAIYRQLKKLEAFSIFSYYSNRPAHELAERLASLAPQPDMRFFLTSGGGEAIDTAVKLARQYHARTGAPSKQHVLSRTNSYHGTNGVGTALAGLEGNRAGFGSYMSESSRISHDSLEALAATISEIGPEKIAAFVFEPVIGAGGVIAPTEGYIEGVIDLCHENEILTIADVVIGGFGRLGTWFGVERWGVQPDLIAFAKGVTSGYQPLGGVAVAPQVAEPFWSAPGFPLNHGPTYSGHPAACAAALANLSILESEGLLERSREMESVLEKRLTDAFANSSAVQEVRAGVGLMAAVVLTDEVMAQRPDAALAVQLAAREQGVIVRGLGGGAIAMSPPLIVDESEIATLVAALESAVGAVTS